MGQVYRARDTKLNRDVALKILPDAFARDPDRLARFTREAQTLASLNHSHIAAIYGIEESDDVRALVMELVEGEDLSQRIARGAIPLDEALPVARQIADALEAAHEQGIIHRDLKPANIKVRPDGTVKVLDFGLAKALNPASAVGVDPMSSPTISLHATQAGIILGTAAYMSPEQAKGRPVDKRADLWAFGAVLYEMVTGQRVFRGDGVSDTIARVLMEEPDWNALPVRTPVPICRLLRRCLEKDLKRRLDSAAAARLDVEEAMTASAEVGRRVADQRPAWRRVLPWSATGTLALSFTLVLLLWAPWRKAAPLAPMRVNVALGVDAVLVTGTIAIGSAAILSPNGQIFAFVAQPRRRTVAVRPSPRSIGRHTLGGHRGRQQPVLFARRRVDRVLRGWEVEEDRVDGRCRSHAVRYAGWQRRHLECGRLDRVRAEHVGRRSAARLVRRRDADAANHSRGG
jgi:eukaryotic-like serine/threonine-protein kinase